jgi:hypothetical protein
MNPWAVTSTNHLNLSMIIIIHLLDKHALLLSAWVVCLASSRHAMRSLGGHLCGRRILRPVVCLGFLLLVFVFVCLGTGKKALLRTQAGCRGLDRRQQTRPGTKRTCDMVISEQRFVREVVTAGRAPCWRCCCCMEVVGVGDVFCWLVGCAVQGNY